MVECNGLENRRGLTPTVGSNPTPSAKRKKVPPGAFFGLWGARRASTEVTDDRIPVQHRDHLRQSLWRQTLLHPTPQWLRRDLQEWSGGIQRVDTAHVGTQRLRHTDAPVRLLMVFQDGNQRAPDRQPRTV